MAVFWISAILLAAALRSETAEYDPSVCDMVTESFGLVEPLLPKNFEYRAELVDHRLNRTRYVELYLDYTNTRGKYMYLENGIEYHYIFDYQEQQVVQYQSRHPGVDIKKDPLSHECIAEDMEDSKVKEIFGYMDQLTLYPKMYDSHQNLKFGRNYRYAFNGTEILTDRGIPIDQFQGCVFDVESDYTAAVDYSFSNMLVAPSGGTTQDKVTYIPGVSVLSVPVRSVFNGTYFDKNLEKRLPMNKTTNFYWFVGEPDFKEDTFKLPPWMYCEEFRGREVIPSIPEAFSTRMQVTKFTRDTSGMTAKEVTSFEKIYYYLEKKLARRDFTPDKSLDTDIYSKFQNYEPVSTIYDFLEGMLYVTHKGSGRCYIRSINHGDFFEVSNGSMFIEMGNPDDIFQMHTDEMEYKGKDYARDIKCGVWTGKYEDEKYNATYVKEMYFSTDGWHADADDLEEYGFPVKHTIIMKEKDGVPVEYVTTRNFLKFEKKPPRLADFDVSNCIETQKHKTFAIMLTITPNTRDLIFKYKFPFLEAAQYYLTQVTRVISPLRVQRLQLLPISIYDKRTLLIFTLVDKIDLKSNAVVSQRGANLEDAIVYLQNFIDQNQFSLKFQDPQTNELLLVAALRGSLYALLSGGNLNFSPLESFQPIGNDPEYDDDERPADRVEEVIQRDDTADKDKKKGMSSGALASLGAAMFLIGIGIGIAVMYFFLRMHSERKVEDRIKLARRSEEAQEGEI